jgi:hypothetical protein
MARNRASDAAQTIDRLIDDVRRDHVPDFRSGIFDVQAESVADGVVLRGETTHPDAISSLLELLSARGVTARDEVIRLPTVQVDGARNALVRSAVAPVYAEPRLPAPQITQLVLGVRVELLLRDGDWLRVRGEDGYLGWVHQGYLHLGPDEWAFAWERGVVGEPVVSLGAELMDDGDNIIARLPWGARLVRHTGAYQLPDGRRGDVTNGEVVDVDRLSDWFPPRGDSVARTARRWLGAPYLWGGVTLNGVDCSGLTQAVLWMHGIALPRDSDLQARVGSEIDVGDDFNDLRAGDLLYFAETEARVSHVAISIGGRQIIHSALGNGGVAFNDIMGEEPLEQRLRRMFTHARRVLPD